MKDIRRVILNVLVKNLALEFEARSFASTLKMTIRRLHFQSSIPAKNLALDAKARSLASTLGMTVCGLDQVPG